MSEFKGVFAPIPIPFKSDESVDYDSLSENLDKWIASPLTGVVMPGSNSEAPYINDQERAEIWKVVGEQFKLSGKLFIAGTGLETTKSTIEQTLISAQYGACATLIVPPNYYKGQMTHDVLVKHYTAVADASPIPVFVYNVPQFSGIDFTMDTLLAMAEHPNIIGIKDSSSNILKMASLLSIKPDFIVFAGTGGAVLPYLSVGSPGNISAFANFGSDAITKIMSAFAEGDLRKAKEVQLAIMALNTSVTGKYGIPGLKYAMDQCGYYGGPSRRPLLPVSPSAKVEIDRQIQKLHELSYM